MSVTRGAIVAGIARGIFDPDMQDWELAELQEAANDAICQTVVALRSCEDDISLPLVATQSDYDAEPCFGITSLSLGGESLRGMKKGDPALAGWASKTAGIPTAFRQFSGATFRVNPTPSAAALTLIGCIAEAPGDGGTGYVVGDELTVAGGTGGIVRVKAVSDGVVTALELIMDDRSKRGTGYSIAADLATTGGTGEGCTVEITALANLEVVGHSGIPAPTSDSDLITAIPESLVKLAVIPLGIAIALENRRTGTVNLELARQKRSLWAGWVGFSDEEVSPKA